MTAPEPKSPGARLLAVAEGERFLTREVAEILGASISMIRKLNATHHDTLGASDIGRDGDRVIWLYTPDDVDRLRRHFAGSAPMGRLPSGRRATRTPRRGRPSLWSAEERTRRDRLYVQAAYHRRRGDKYAADGQDGLAAGHHAKAEQIKTCLDAEAAQRLAERRYIRPLDVIPSSR